MHSNWLGWNYNHTLQRITFWNLSEWWRAFKAEPSWLKKKNLSKNEYSAKVTSCPGCIPASYPITDGKTNKGCLTEDEYGSYDYGMEQKTVTMIDSCNTILLTVIFFCVILGSCCGTKRLFIDPSMYKFFGFFLHSPVTSLAVLLLSAYESWVCKSWAKFHTELLNLLLWTGTTFPLKTHKSRFISSQFSIFQSLALSSI